MGLAAHCGRSFRRAQNSRVTGPGPEPKIGVEHMQRSMCEIKCEVTDRGLIKLSQTDCGEEFAIVITPDQVDVLKEWLDEAKSEIAQSCPTQ